MLTEKENSFRKLYARCHLLAIIIIAVVFGATLVMMKVIPTFSEMTKEKAMVACIICICVAVLLIVIWAIGMYKVLDDLLLVYNATGYPRIIGDESMTGWVQCAKISIITGEQVVGRVRMGWHPRLLHLFLNKLISKKFENHVKHNKELQIKYYDEQVYNAARKNEVKNTITDLSVDVAFWELCSIVFLMFDFICLFFSVLRIMG